MDITAGDEAFCKDTAYRLLNSVRVNWRRFILLLSQRIIDQSISGLTAEDRIKVLVADSVAEAIKWNLSAGSMTM